MIVGRERELDALRHAMTSSFGSEGQCVLLVGEAGIGKSRLAREVTGWATEHGARVATGRAVPASAVDGLRAGHRILAATVPARPVTG